MSRARASDPIAPALAAKFLDERGVTPELVEADHRLIGHLVVAVMANGFNSSRIPLDLPAVRLELEALTMERML